MKNEIKKINKKMKEKLPKMVVKKYGFQNTDFLPINTVCGALISTESM
jgi:hypothetical protein